MTRWRPFVVTLGGASWLALGLAMSMVVLSWSGYRAIQEWQRSATLLAERRAQEAADVLASRIHDPTSWLADPQVQAMGVVSSCELPGHGPLPELVDEPPVAEDPHDVPVRRDRAEVHDPHVAHGRQLLEVLLLHGHGRALPSWSSPLREDERPGSHRRCWQRQHHG